HTSRSDEAGRAGTDPRRRRRPNLDAGTADTGAPIAGQGHRPDVLQLDPAGDPSAARVFPRRPRGSVRAPATLVGRRPHAYVRLPAPPALRANGTASRHVVAQPTAARCGPRPSGR